MSTSSNPADSKKSGGALRRAILIGTGLALVIVAVVFYLAHRGKESTDDSFIEAHVIQISPQIAERVQKVHVDDNQMVKKGICSSSWTIKTRSFSSRRRKPISSLPKPSSCRPRRSSTPRTPILPRRARTSKKRRPTRTMPPRTWFATASCTIAAPSPSGNTTTRKCRRFHRRRPTTASSRAALSAESTVKVRAAEVKAAEAQVVQAQAMLDAARLRLSYTKINAPASGRITRKNVEPGSYVQTGSALLAVVPPEVWVVANFKETQLDQMRPGQPVDVRIDAYPSLKVRGWVDSIQSGTGSRFSLLPSENATGNYVKVVQRVPVKILLDLPKDAPELTPGMSVVPTVHVDQPGRTK